MRPEECFAPDHVELPASVIQGYARTGDTLDPGFLGVCALHRAPMGVILYLSAMHFETQSLTDLGIH